MGRRLSLLIGMLLAAGTGAALAAPSDDPPAPAPPSPSKAPAASPVELPPAELPPGFDSKATNLGPEPTPPETPAAPAAPAEGGKPGLNLGKLLGKAREKARAAGDAGAKPRTNERDAGVTRTKAEPPATPPAAAEQPPLPPPPAQDAPDALPPPAAVPAPVPAPAPTPGAPAEGLPPRDAQVVPSQTPPPGGAPAAAPAATPAAPAAAAPAAAAPPREPKPPFVLTAEEVPLGKQNVGVTVDVVAPSVLNLNQTASFKILVRNNGDTDARGVVVRDLLPEGLTFVSSQPEPEKIDALLAWNLGNVPANSEKLITLTVKPAHTGSFDHSATVTLMAGAKSRTIVREPKLKVEQKVSTAKVLLGQQVQFRITVSNPGDGPARNVVVQARLSPGLHHESIAPSEQNLLEFTLDLVQPGESVVLEPLVVDAKQGNEQSCQVTVLSPDVAPNAPEAKSVAAVHVIEPKLKMTLVGDDKRYTDTLATYKIELDNPGTAPAQNVKIQATVPVSGRLYQEPPGAQFNPQTRRLSWVRPQLQPGEKAVFTFQMRVNGIGLYQVAAEARADSGLLDKQTMNTDVIGLADVEVTVAEKRRVVDVNDQTVYQIKVTNAGTKEATRIQVSAVLSANLEAVETSGTEVEAKFNPTENLLKFPLIERLGPNKSVELGILVKVKATDPKIATCRVFVLHDDLGKDEKLEDIAAFKITPTRR